jgi:hypothetical protein
MNDEELRTAEFNRITDRYMREGVISAYDYEGLTPSQIACVQWAKRAFNRISRKDDRTTENSSGRTAPEVGAEESSY